MNGTGDNFESVISLQLSDLRRSTGVLKGEIIPQHCAACCSDVFGSQGKGKGGGKSKLSEL